MALPLPYTITDPPAADPIQGNFEALKQQFPLSRKHMKMEESHIVGAAGEPAFQNSWVNYDLPTYYGAQFWKDALGLVHVEGMIKNGTVGFGITAFVLPAGYRPLNGLLYAIFTSTGAGRVDITPTGNVSPVTGGNTWFSISVPPFRGEQ